MPRKTIAAALAALTLAAIPAASAGAGTRWSTILDEQAEQVVTVGVHPFPGSGAAPGTYRPSLDAHKPEAPRWSDTWYVRLPGDTDYLVGPVRTGGPEFREVVVPAGALVEVGWGGDVYLVDVTTCGGPDRNLLEYAEPHMNVPALPLSAGRTSVSVTCTTPPAPPVSLPPVTTPPTTAPPAPPTTTPPTRQLLPPAVTTPTTTTTPPAQPGPGLELTTTVQAPALAELPVTGINPGLAAAFGFGVTAAGLALLAAANRHNK